MILVDTQPRLADLHTLIANIPNYPISAGGLVDLARQQRFPPEVLDFYRFFPAEEVFRSQDELVARTEQIEIMSHHDAPTEKFVSAEED